MPRASQDYNLYVLKPELIMEWHPTMNNSVRPKDVTPGSGKRVWWLCQEGHEWQAVVYSRSRGSGCPHCYKGNHTNGTQLILTDTTFVTEWHPTKNGNLSLRRLDSDSGQKVWWLCQNGHDWQATIKSRLKGVGCPHCGETSGQEKASMHTSRFDSNTTAGEEENGLQIKWPMIGPEILDMKSGTDFRKDKRFEFQDTIMLENKDSGHWCYGHSVNISGVGLFFESEVPFNSGVRLVVQFNHPPFKSMQKTFPTIVRWCKELSYDSTASYFGVGVEFL